MSGKFEYGSASVYTNTSMSKDCECDSVYVTEELIVQILKRLPVQSLLRFMSVCRSWYSLIRNPHFISTHLNYQIALRNSNEGLRYLLYLDLRNLNRYYVHFDNHMFNRHLRLIFPGEFRVVRVGCCNGVVCLGHNSRPFIVLWNPSLRKTLDLNIPHKVVDVGEAFSHGFGFDAESNDFKVVSIAYATTNSLETRPGGVYVYALNVGYWRRLNDSFVLPSDSKIHFKGVHVSGVIHWLVERTMGNTQIPVSILTFNLADETFGEVSLPGDMVRLEYATLMHFLSSDIEKEHLAIVRARWGSYSLWVMDLDGLKVSWRVILSEKYFDGYRVRRLVNVRRNGKIMVELEEGRVVSVDLTDMSSKTIAYESLDYVGTYVENLVLV